ncbi:CaiB/BaiF CoA transferase family protein [Chloroflexota bacterium]
MAGILEGIRVMDMGHHIAIPAAGAVLADWGADVIKVEPLTGDQLRGAIRIQGVDTGATNSGFEFLNRNKRSIALDLKQKPGKDIFDKLVKLSDVFISNYQLGALEKLKADYATLSQLNPAIIYGVLSGYGTKGAEKDEKGFDFTSGWARSGTQHLMAVPGSYPPAQRAGMYDRTAGLHCVAAVCAALLHREKTGKGQEFDYSLYHVGVYNIASDIQNALVGVPERLQDRTRAGPLWNSYRAGNDRWFQLAMQTDEYWPGLCRAMERSDLENDSRFNSLKKRTENCEELIKIMDEVFASRDRDEWEGRFRENGVIYGRIETPLEVVNDPQALANDFFAEIDHPVEGKLKLINMPIKFHQNPAEVKTPAPELGQHTEEILLDLGYDWDDVSRLKEQNVIL